jgi:cytochrome c oxidase cbb3-type subunit 3
MADPNDDRLLDHSYDGIQEYDNPMPRWWVILFWATIVFSILYLLNVPFIGKGDGRIADYKAEVARADAQREQLAPAGRPDTEMLLALAADSAVIAGSRVQFATHCAVCHRADGGGLIGPNLTDDSWIHGGSITDILSVIDQGVLEKGMPPWGKVLRPELVYGLTAYVWTLRGSNPPDPKPPEGTRVTP